jgi:hypothetical protein
MPMLSVMTVASLGRSLVGGVRSLTPRNLAAREAVYATGRSLLAAMHAAQASKRNVIPERSEGSALGNGVLRSRSFVAALLRMTTRSCAPQEDKDELRSSG